MPYNITLDNYIYAEAIALSQRLACQACLGGSNFKNMLLMVQCLKLVNIDKNSKVSASDSYSGFCELFFRGDLEDENFATEFNAAIKTLQKDVFSNPHIVLTIFSNSADTMLIKNFQPHWIIGDKIGATFEPDFIVPIVHNIKSVERIIGVGDVKQLAPVVLSCRQSREDKLMVNEFADGLAQPFLLRAQLVGYPCSLFTECFRCTKGLEQPASKLFYQGKVVNSPGTELSNRPKSQMVVDMLRQGFHIDTDVP